MGPFDDYKRFDHPGTPNIGAVISTFKAMHAEEPGSDEHERLLEAFGDAVDRMTNAADQRTLFERELFRGWRSRYLREVASLTRA